LNTTAIRAVVRPEATFEEPRFDEQGMRLDDSGQIVFRILRNDGSRQALVTLNALKHTIGKQLPEMGTGYISRILFDVRHISIVCWHGEDVLGGITFRPFSTPECCFGEIVFCVVYRGDKYQHLKGVGARMMNRLKHECLHTMKPAVTRFLTYADDTAIGFFSRLGFTRNITLPHHVWRGRIKDYVKATLMECVIREGVDYRAIPDMVHIQRQRLLELFPVHSGSKALPADVAARLETPDENTVQNMLKLHEGLVRHDKAAPFHQPVQELRELYLGYAEKIRNPIDLLMIKSRLDQKPIYYRTMYMFLADVFVMLRNCQLFNGKGSIFYEDSEYLVRWLGEQCTRMNCRKEWERVKTSTWAAYERDLAKMSGE
jgi:histone acetyltransferase